MDLTSTNFKDYVFLSRSINGGHQVVVKFPNGFGASIVQGPYTYGGPDGKFELGVVEFNESGKNYDLTYDTPIIDDVLGHLSKKDCFDYLHKIMALPHK